ncbi:hypothetical protein K504DRAFT_476808 [Pleomassaria siparia CBS 279.74]|uniref:Uncharacterized protein n=1 Tax=Pleomassaria siparia CBS 279.74 TaxID=1314801 RepID=A0A6G1KAN1_9PLEO|nr:hypothetical protein K504DRAFT_476808 [Pleomassaria siparia CBS 279.74]
MNYRRTPPYSASSTPEPVAARSPPSPPRSLAGSSLTSSLQIPTNLEQDVIDSDPELKRHQQDLLLLTGFSDNTTLHWRPSWFDNADEFANRLWTLHNPPNVVTEFLPRQPRSRPVATRRMRRVDDPPALFIKSWEHWYRYCEMYGIPGDFLCAEQVAFMRSGLRTSGDGSVSEVPSFPLYPEPQPLGRGRYPLDPNTYHALPGKYQAVSDDEVIVVHSSGALEVVPSKELYFHESQWTHFNGRGEYVDDYWYDCNPDVMKTQGIGRLWSHLPWTKAQEVSCRPLRLKLRLSSGALKRPTDVQK